MEEVCSQMEDHLLLVNLGSWWTAYPYICLSASILPPSAWLSCSPVPSTITLWRGVRRAKHSLLNLETSWYCIFYLPSRAQGFSSILGSHGHETSHLSVWAPQQWGASCLISEATAATSLAWLSSHDMFPGHLLFALHNPGLSTQFAWAPLDPGQGKTTYPTHSSQQTDAFLGYALLYELMAPCSHLWPSSHILTSFRPLNVGERKLFKDDEETTYSLQKEQYIVLTPGFWANWVVVQKRERHFFEA